MWVRITWMTRGFKIFLLLLLIHTFAHQQFPFLPVLSFTHRIPIPYYLSILSIYHRLLLWKQSETSSSSFRSAAFLTGPPSLSDSFIQLVPRKYIISYTHSIAITLIHHSSSSHFLFFCAHAPPDSGFKNSVYIHTYIHYITHRAVVSLLLPFSFPFFLVSRFFLIRSSFSILESLWIIAFVMSFCFLHQNKTVISAGKP